MKSTLLRLIALLVLLLCMLVPACAGAISGQELTALRGERSYPQALDLPDAQAVASNSIMPRSGESTFPKPDENEIRRLTQQYAEELTDLGSAVDFLSVFADNYAGALVNQANHLQSVYLIAEERLSNADKKLVGDFIAQYSQIASSLYAEVEFFNTKLSYAYERIEFLIQLIQSGECTPSEIDAYMAELDAVAKEAEERLSAFRTEEKHLYTYLYRYFEASLMISGMTDGVSIQLDTLHNASNQVIQAQAKALYELENSGGLRAASTHIVVVSRSQYVVVARDEKKAPIADADVTVLVLDGNNNVVSTLTGKTDQYGYSIFCYDDFRPDKDDNATIDVRVHAKGYRTQFSGKLYVQGGGFTELHMEKDDGNPYLILASYNHEDILRVSNGIYITPYNDANQRLSFTVNTQIPCTVQLYQPESGTGNDTGTENIIAEFSVDPSKPDASLVQDPTYKTEYTRTFSNTYGSDAFFKSKLPVYTRIIWEQSGNAQGGNAQGKAETQTPFSVKKARVPNPTFVNDANKFMGSIGFTLPSDWPLIGGARFTLPVNPGGVQYTFFLNTDGTLYAGVSVKVDLMKDGGWKNQAARQQSAIEKGIVADNIGKINAFKAGVASNYSMMKRQHVVASLTADVTPYMMVIARRTAIEDDETSASTWYEYQGDLTLGAIAALHGALTLQATAGPIPVFLGFEFNLGFNFCYKVGMKFDMLGAFGGFRNFSVSDDSSIRFSPYLDIIVTAGAGIPRLAYVGIQGRFYITADFVLAPKPGILRAKGEVRISLDVCVFFFRHLYKLWGLSYSWRNPEYPQSAILLSSLEEELAQARTQREALTVSRDASLGTQQTEKTTVRSIQPIGTKDNNVLFVPISMKHPFVSRSNELSDSLSLPDMCLALWLQKQPDGRTLITYSNTQLNTQDDLDPSGSTSVLQLNSEFNGWEVVDFDVEYFCMPDRPFEYPSPPVLYFALSIVPIGTPDSEVALKSRLLYLECQVLVTNIQTQPRIVINCLQQKMLSTQDAEQPGITMPRIERTNGGYHIGAIATYPTTSRRAVLLYDSDAAYYEHPWAWTVAQDLSSDPGDDWEIAEFQLLDRRFSVPTSSQVEHKYFPGYVLLMRSTTDEAKSRFFFYPGHIDTRDPFAEHPELQRLGGDTLNFSNFQIIEEYDELYNTRQVGIGALRLLRNAQTGQLSTTLCLMTLDRNQDTGIGVWLSLNPTDTGVNVGADGLSFLEINGSYYACWLTSTTKPDNSRDYELQASYISLKHGIAGQPFTLLHLCRYVDTDAQKHIARALLLPLTRSNQGLLYGVLLEKLADGSSYRWGKFSYGIQMSMEVTALVPEMPVILPGDTFISRIAVRNTGMIPIYNFSIDYMTHPEDSAASSDVFVKQIAVDMQDMENNEVRNVDRNTGAVTSTALQGEASVYRMEDGSKERNGEIAHTLVYTTVENGGLGDREDVSPTPQERTVTVASLPADGTLDLRTSFTAPLDCWGDTEKQPNVILTARVHNMEAGTELNRQPDSAVYASERDGAVTLNAPLSAQNDEGQSAESDRYFGKKLTLPIEAVYYAPYDLSGKRIDTADFRSMKANNLILEADVAMVGGVPTVQITLRNLDGTQAEDVVPMLVAMVDGKETWRKPLSTALSNGFTCSLSVPLAELAGGKPYSSIDLYLVGSSKTRNLTAASLDFASFGEVNSFDNHVRLYPVYDFYFLTEPQSTTVFVGKDVTLTAEAAGESGPFTYQWYELAPDGTLRPLRGETGTSLTLKKLTLSSHNTKYLCAATNRQNVVLHSHVATLTVSEELPVTGDTSHPIAWLALLGLSGLALLLLIVRRRSSK